MKFARCLILFRNHTFEPSSMISCIFGHLADLPGPDGLASVPASSQLPISRWSLACHLGDRTRTGITTPGLIWRHHEYWPSNRQKFSMAVSATRDSFVIFRRFPEMIWAPTQDDERRRHDPGPCLASRSSNPPTISTEKRSWRGDVFWSGPSEHLFRSGSQIAVRATSSLPGSRC